MHGAVPVQQCPRLAALVMGEARGDVRVQLAFAANGADQPACEGLVETELQLECQRCLEPVLIKVRGEVRAEFVGVDAEPRAEGFEGVSVDGETLSLIELIEDEILLALPFAPSHEAGECATAVDDEDIEAEAPGERVRPFAQLRDLLDNKS